jgi:predicted dehydrogenase
LIDIRRLEDSFSAVICLEKKTLKSFKFMNKQRIAIVGCGGIVDHYLSIYRDLEWIEVTTCIDIDTERARKTAETLFNASHKKHFPRATDDFADALKSDVETVIINTPNHLHREQAIAALNAGKNILLQKPVAANLEDAQAILEAAQIAARKNVTSGLYMSYFDQPLMYDLREMIGTGWFGEVAHFYARLMHRGGLDWSRQALGGNPTWRGSIEQTGGGCFIQLAIHYIHLFQWMLDSKVVGCTAIAKNLFSPGLEGEDIACAILEFENGTLATIDVAWNTSGEQLSIHGTRGTCEYLDNHTLSLSSEAGEFFGQVVAYQKPRLDAIHLAPGFPAHKQTLEIIAPPVGEINNSYNQQRLFLEAVRRQTKPFVSIESGLEDMKIVAAIYESVRSKKTIEIERDAKTLEQKI